MTPAEAVLRARSALGHGCAYKLGAGGMDPRRTVPWNEAHECDCSGFVMWVLGLSRALWYDTSRIRSEALGNRAHYFEAIPWEAVAPGDLLVYGDRRGTDGVERQGHVGIVSEAAPHGVPSGPVLVVHCSSGAWMRDSDAIREDAPGLWVNHPESIVARCTILERNLPA